ncbi:hypothetical protein SMICM304S_08914 [Streptomyces microflavus]
MLPLVREALAGHRLADDLDVLAGAGQRLVELDTVPALGDLRAQTPRPSRKRPPESESRVAAVIAVMAGWRAGICMIAEPTSMDTVCAATQ